MRDAVLKGSMSRWSAVPDGAVWMARTLEISNLASLALAFAAAMLAGQWSWAPVVSLAFAAASFSATLGLCCATDILFRRIPTPAARSLAACGLAASISVALLGMESASGWTVGLAPAGSMQASAAESVGLVSGLAIWPAQTAGLAQVAGLADWPTQAALPTDASLVGSAVAMGVARSLGGALVMGIVASAGALLGRLVQARSGARREASPVGGGDIRLMIVIGAACGPTAVLSLLVACVLACAYCLATRSKSAPFGPCLALPGLALLLAQAVSVL